MTPTRGYPAAMAPRLPRTLLAPLGDVPEQLRALADPAAVREWVRGHREDDLPAQRWTPAFAAKFAFDEWTLQIESVRGRMRVPSTDFRRRLRTELDEAMAVFGDRGWLDDPRTYHRDPPPLQEVRIGRVGAGPFAFEHLQFPSGYEPDPTEPGAERWAGYRRNRTAHAWVLRGPARADGAPRPWVICVNGYRAGEPLTDLTTFRVQQLLRLGLDVAVLVQPLHGPRRAGTSSGDRVIFSGAMNLVHAVTQAAWDVRRLVSWVRDEQGAPRVGLSGISLGGLVVSLTAALDDRVDLVIAGVPEADIVRGMRRNVEPLLPPFYEQWGLSWRPLEQVTQVISPLAMPAVVPKAGRFLFGGLGDRWVRPGNVRALWEHWDRPEICWYQGSHLSFLVEPEVRRFVDDALRRTLLPPAS